MKVGTDGVLLGAWTTVENAQRILDIGTGSGLIALMLAQRCPQAHIFGIDINEAAASQAIENAQQSPFADRISIENVSVQAFSKSYHNVFDTIVSNPPFFVHSLPASTYERTVARHSDTLSLSSLFESVARLSSDTGTFSIVYPIDALSKILDCAAERSLFLQRQTTVFPTPDVQAKRVLLAFSKQPASDISYNELVIEKERHHYSDDFRALAKDFYLKL